MNASSAMPLQSHNLDATRPATLMHVGRRWQHTLTMIAKRLLLMTLVTGCASTTVPDGLQSVRGFDLARYAGVWHEIARLDHSFERGLSNVSATYTVQPDGSVQVRNRGYSQQRQDWQQAIGKAQFIGEPTQGSLKVSFFGPFYGGYHIIALDKGYRWSLVVGPDRSYFWILARDRHLSTALRGELLDRAAAAGIPIDKLIWVLHDREDPALR